jgi:hypothetical protein
LRVTTIPTLTSISRIKITATIAPMTTCTATGEEEYVEPGGLEEKEGETVMGSFRGGSEVLEAHYFNNAFAGPDPLHGE